MSPIHTCPDNESLQQLLLGHLTSLEAERLEKHLTDCAHCAAQATRLEGADTVVEALRARPASAAAPVDEVLETLMSRLKGLQIPTDQGATAPLPSPGGGAPPFAVAGLLAPPQGPDELGRLGPYRVVKVLGFGGMGVVFEAEDTQLKRTVALKVMKPDLASNASARRRFLREARAAAAVKHDNVVTIYQVGEDPPFLAMELLPGESLSDRLQREGRLESAEVIRIGRQVAEGLSVIHERGLVHRDIKPSNIWLESSRVVSGGVVSGKSDIHHSPTHTHHSPIRVKILDFGVARPEEGDATVTGTNQVVGTPAYIAPEQARGEKADQRSDLFSLGCVLYQLCTGQRPFRGDTSMAILTSLAMDTPQPITGLAADATPALAELIMQLLAKDPAQRPASAQAVAAALMAMETDLPRAATGQRPAPRGTRRRVLVAVAAAIVLLAGTWPVAQVIIRIRYPDGTVKDIPAPQGAEVEVIKDPGKAKANPFDAFQRDQLTNEELAAAGSGDAKNAPAELVGMLRGPHTSLVALALHPDGKHLVSGDDGGSVCVWDLFTRKHVVTFPGERSANSLSFSADGGRLATTIWKSGPAVFESTVAATLLKRTVTHIPDYHASSVALSPGGQRLAASTLGGFATVWDVDSSQVVGTLTGHTHAIRRVVFSPDGTRLATASADGTIKTWDVQTGKELKTFQGAPASRQGPLHSVAFSPKGGLLAGAGLADQVTIWDAGTGQEVATCTAEFGHAHGLTFSPDASLVAAAAFARVAHRGELIVWHARSGKVARQWRLPGRAWSVLFAPDGRHLLAGDETGTIYVMRLKST